MQIYLLIVDVGTYVSISFVPENAIEGDHLTRLPDSVFSQGGRKLMIHSDNGLEFTRRTIQIWVHSHGIALRLFETGKLNQNTYANSFDCRLRDAS